VSEDARERTRAPGGRVAAADPRGAASAHANLGRARDAVRQVRRTFPFVGPDAGTDPARAQRPVVIAGAGPVGLTLALALARYGVPTLVLERRGALGHGSRAICWAKRSLEILDQFGVAEALVARGVTWNVGKVYVGASAEPLYAFDLLPDKAQQFPAFINLQQYYAEEILIDRLAHEPLAELRWQHEVAAVADAPDGVAVTVRTPAGDYAVRCAYLVAADGCRSAVRGMLGLDFEGRAFEDHFLIADVKMRADFPAERRFWFDPPFNPGRTSLLHKQADDVLRIDFQLGRDVDREQTLCEAAVDAKVRGFLGPDAEYEYEWVSLYTFQCRRMRRFVHGRVVFAGDAAHIVSPFGARGANGGIQDADNLAWKLAYVLGGRAPATLLASYDDERTCAADENIANSTRSTDFMTPATAVARAFRDAALDLAREHAFARGLVNSGRLSVPCVLAGSPLTTPDADAFTPKQRPGAPCLDAPVVHEGRAQWLLRLLGGRFVGLAFAEPDGRRPDGADALRGLPVPIETLVVARAGGVHVDVVDADVRVHAHYDARPGSYYLIRPDQHVAARWRRFDPAAVRRALDRALGKPPA
jgi:3-(3-hydroxy-phenyl)propionate hydroxylase